jgi:hypothetical protein
LAQTSDGLAFSAAVSRGTIVALLNGLTVRRPSEFSETRVVESPLKLSPKHRESAVA